MIAFFALFLLLYLHDVIYDNDDDVDVDDHEHGQVKIMIFVRMI